MVRRLGCAFRSFCTLAKSHDSLFQDTFEFCRILGSEKNVPPESLFLVQQDVLAPVRQVQLESKDLAFLQVQAQRFNGRGQDFDPLNFVERNLRGSEPRMKFDSVVEDLVFLPKTLRGAFRGVNRDSFIGFDVLVIRVVSQSRLRQDSQVQPQPNRQYSSAR